MAILKQDMDRINKMNQLKIDLYIELYNIRVERLTDVEVDLMYTLSKDPVIQNLLLKQSTTNYLNKGKL